MTDPMEYAERSAPSFEDDFAPQEIPCTIHVRDRSVFKVTNINSWGYMEHGIFAIGHWGLELGMKEQSVLIPYGSFTHITFDFDALARWQEKYGASISN